MNAISPPVASSLAKLIRLLSSTHEGEVLGAVQALGRTLKSAGLDIHDLAAHVEVTTPFQKVQVVYRDIGVTPPAVPMWDELKLSQQRDWLKAILLADWPTIEERKLVVKVAKQIHDRPDVTLTLAQCRKLQSAFLKARMHGTRP